jgi:hypothetical protein
MANAATDVPTAESIAKYVKKNSVAVKRAAAGMMVGKGHGARMESVREDDYEGHHIVIRTSYTITIDGKEIMAHLALTNDGEVQYHGLPNYSFDSAIDLVKKMIDVYPDDFPASGEKPQARRSRGGTGRDGMDAKMTEAAMPKMKSRSKKRVLKKVSAKRPAKGRK